ncbi:MAG: hypothetical protein KAH20_13110 [Methylococcales bacterium]|nr:hypothetical protein [Methylococcales bacterium]
MWLELKLKEKSGYFRIPVDHTTPDSCDGSYCIYSVEFTAQHELAETLSFAAHIEVSGSNGTQHGAAKDFAWSSDCDNDPVTAKPYCTEPTGTYVVAGKIQYYHRTLQADFSDPHPKSPQYAYSEIGSPIVTPAPEVMVRVEDGCGLYHDQYTNENGDYAFTFESWCGEKDATVKVYSITNPSPGKNVRLGLYTATPNPQNYSDLDNNPDLYTIISGNVGTFNPEEDAKFPGLLLNRTFTDNQQGPLFQKGLFSRSGEVARSLTILSNTMKALDYYRLLVSPNQLPQINVVLTNNVLNDDYNFSFFSKNKSNMIYITPDSEWSAWAVTHETSHYFDGGILVKDGLTNYGRWGEPMANVRAGSIIGSSWMVARNGVDAENLDIQGNWNDSTNEVKLLDEALNLSSQGWIWRILWDLHDGGANVVEPGDFGYSNFDNWNGGGSGSSALNHLINGVILNYLPQRNGDQHPEYEDRGLPGPDLVDMLDGFACLYGMNQLHLQVMLHDLMNFDYDFAKCNDSDIFIPNGG